MNLLTDDWVPVSHKGDFKHISLQNVLCEDESWEIACPRDDFELATLQLLICLTQVLFTPSDPQQLRQSHQNKLTIDEYKKGIQPYLEWFDLLHPKYPFMQVRGVESKEFTPIQKLIIGLPEGNNHAFFNAAGEVKSIGLNYAAIALFHQASNCPSFGGGFKGSLRGGAPLSTFIKGASLRQTIWLNVLHQDYLNKNEYPDTNPPVWVDLIQSGQKIYPHQISFFKGLFWQPAHIELLVDEKASVCDISGQPISKRIYGFKKEKFNYELADTWRHPHSPLSWVEKKGISEKRYASFTTTAPAWTQLSQFVLEQEEKKEGYSPALVVSQFNEVFPGKSLALMIGGYRNKQAAILERRHELLNLSEGWDRNAKFIKSFIELALAIKKNLRDKLYGFGKKIGIEGLSDQAETMFYQDSEIIIYNLFRQVKWSEAKDMQDMLYIQLSQLAQTIFEYITQPYQHEPKMIKALITSRRSMRAGLKKLQIQEVA